MLFGIVPVIRISNAIPVTIPTIAWAIHFPQLKFGEPKINQNMWHEIQ